MSAPSRMEPYQFQNRSYSDRTRHLLFGLSANRCAHPDCRFPLIASATCHDQAAILGHIAHIYSASSEGPRPYPLEDVSEEIINGYDNLLLLCRHHHAEVDGQQSSFPVETLRKWKVDHTHRVLATRASVLPERFRQFAWMGARFTLQVLDGTIESIGAPVSQIVREEGVLVRRDVLHVDRQLWIRLDDGQEFDLKLRNQEPPGREGTRVTLLYVLDGAGKALPYSVFNHASATWTPLNQVWQQFTWSVSRIEWLIGFLLIAVLHGSAMILPPSFGLPVHDSAPTVAGGFAAIPLLGAALRHWRLWRHAAKAMRATRIV